MTNAQITKTAAAAPVVAAPVAAANAIAQMVASAPVAAAIAAADAKPAKPARTVRPAQKPVAKVESIVAASAPVLAVKYQITVGRPSAGRALRAYTEAVLQLLGMYKGKAVPRAQLAKIVGDTAVGYHTKKTGAFSDTAKGIILTPSYGNDYFGVRVTNKEFDLADVEAFKAILTTGKPDGRLVKVAAHIKAI